MKWEGDEMSLRDKIVVLLAIAVLVLILSIITPMVWLT